jgi:hypothetical protein
MKQLHDDLVDKLARETAILVRMYRNDSDGTAHVVLLVDQAKRVRRTSTMLVKALATERDNPSYGQEA